MKFISPALVLCAAVIVSCAHGPQSASTPILPGEAASSATVAVASYSLEPQTAPLQIAQSEASPPATQSEPTGKTSGDEGDVDYGMDISAAEKVTIDDPWEPFNRAMFTFNDRLYFWFLKPVAQGYSVVVPEPARVSVSNFFSNLRAPIRFVNCILQANFIGAATELFRFMINSSIGLAGLFDPAGSEEINLVRQDEDFGQTLGVYGAGPGFYIVWPILGPSSPRDTVGMVGDFFAYPISYLDPWYAWLAVRGYQMVNDTSLSIGDYEAIKEAAIDPYASVRNAYAQYRQKKVEEKGATTRRPGPDIPGAGTPARGIGP
ncbi:MAG TPA: VacJ family lipoprotein [Syntrophales bacterium]|nr:VacJ family lipoprotein [Syntrophales bacterium]